MRVYFIGAGPGDPELMTLKGARLVREADIVIYAGSLVNPEVLREVQPSCRVYDSAVMTLDEIMAVMLEGVRTGKRVVRVHTGDPAIYGAIQEQMMRLDWAGVGYEIVPGVSSFCGASAVLQRELTIPGKAQTVILTRFEGQTPVPEREALRALAYHQSSMVIFLSVGMIDGVVKELCEHYAPETPAAVVYKATWPDEKKIIGTLETIAEQTREAGVNKTALILVGDFLRADRAELSLLYSPSFSHEYRKARGADPGCV